MNKEEKDCSVVLAKRMVDILLSASVLTILSPFVLFALIALFMEHALTGQPFAPLFYVDTRMSKGRKFSLYKFNIFSTAIVNMKKTKGEFIHTKDLERNGNLAVVGYILKQIYMDELPQFWNVLRGDMSVVGPRPVNEKVFADLINRGFNAKTKVKAGITGNFQSYKNGFPRTDREMDQEYVDYCKTHSWFRVILFDFSIMLRTIKVIVRAKGV